MVLRAGNLSKAFGGVRALRDVDLEVDGYEIHALVGENGAGKSTLIKILSGAVTPDAGSVLLDGAPLPTGDPRAVRRRGINVVYQEFTLVPDLTVTENVFLGREEGRIFLRRTEMDRAVQQLLDDLDLQVPVSARVRHLSVAQQQMVEIARALAGDARVLILDEPTATLSEVEVQILFRLVRRLRDRGLGIVYISHRLDEIFAMADRVTVLRDGERVASTTVAQTDRAQLIRWMVGRDVSEEFPARTSRPGATVLDVRALSSPPRFRDVSLTVRQGEIVGLAGLVGAGRTSTALALVGALPARGDVWLNGERVRFSSPGHAIARGLAYVTEDRKAHGIFPSMTAGQNITLTYLSDLARLGVLDLTREQSAASAAAREVDLRASLTQLAARLSGGNQQKMLLARYLLKPRTLVILDEPTRGVDVGARAGIYRLMNDLAATGLAILMISSDLPELLGMADRVLVLREGRTKGELARGDATPEAVMALAAAG